MSMLFSAGILQRLDQEPTFVNYLQCAKALENAGGTSPESTVVRVGVLRNFTVEPLIQVLKAELARVDFDGQFYLGDYDVMTQEALDPKSGLYGFQPHFIILACWLETLAPNLAGRFVTLSSEQVAIELQDVLGRLGELLDAIRSQCAAPILLNNFPLPQTRTLGILDAQSEQHSHTQTLLELNRRLGALARSRRDVYIVDYLTLIAETGSNLAIDRRCWELAKAPLGTKVLVPMAREYGAFLRALRGKTRKCLVLDCDNTLWGGVVGEDGLDGIRLSDTYPGSAYRAFQREILNLHSRGVLLALCSKNDEAAVLEVLRSHPEMLIREPHLATRQVNWNDKASNLRQIARDLNIGLDSLVFVDDSEFECELVRQQLPEVAVVQLSTEPSDFCNILTRARHFDSLSFSEEDCRRTEMYRQDTVRSKLRESATSLDDYLMQLQIVAEIDTPDAALVPRVSQLTQKTNQFNLTTRRYTEGDIQAFLERDDVEVTFIRLRDRCAELGVVGVAIVVYASDVAEVDTLLLSCRALGRSAEDAMLARVLNRARERGCRVVRGCYLRTPKNGQVDSFYEARGFSRMIRNEGGEQWELSLDKDHYRPPAWIVVQSAEKGALKL